MSLRVTTLVENTTNQAGLLAEHGLSMLLESRGCQILFDTGQTNTAVHNARAMGVDLSRVHVIALSHGHYDHTGGLRDVLREVAREDQEVEVIAHVSVFDSHYSVRKDSRAERPRYVGIPFSRPALEGEGAAFRLIEGPADISDCALLTGEVPRLTSFEHIDSNLRLKEDGDWVQDQVFDDQALVVRTEEGLVVLVGCAHAGLINTLEYARRIAGEERILAVIGGTHLGPASAEQLEETIAVLKRLHIAKLGVSHCTGQKAAARLAQEFGETFFFNVAGTVTELP